MKKHSNKISTQNYNSVSCGKPILNKLTKCNNKTKQVTNSSPIALQIHSVLGSPTVH